jgi:hypothetical protein
MGSGPPQAWRKLKKSRARFTPAGNRKQGGRTDGEDIPGSTCQAATFEELVDTVFALAPDCLQSNGDADAGQPIDTTITPLAAKLYGPPTAVALSVKARAFTRFGSVRHQRTVTVPANIDNR